ncbi:hypothetical protein C8P67_11240 [Flavobacterium aquicola]|uniref:Histone H1-like protein Hc1 n=2 Tax=Flavobacteriaceae TaxID=49546 RepID=A0A3E0EBZ3_9FLAO|nr:hypothetical protein C8P67_11240 [Flavobacterium aquicola]
MNRMSFSNKLFAYVYYSSIFVSKNLNKIIMKDLVAKINAEIETFKTESESLVEKGVKAAGARARKSSLEIEKLLKEFRKVSVEESKK